MRQLRLGGLVFDGGLARQTPFTLASFSRSVGTRRERVARAFAHGSFVMPGFLEEQEFSWSGLILTNSAHQQNQEMWRLSSLLADGGQSQLVLSDTYDRWADVNRVDAPVMRVVVPGRVASYQVSVVASDPRMYGEVREFPGGVPSVHFGNFSASPRLLVGPGSGGYAVNSSNGGRIFVQSSAPSGAHVLDLAAGGLFLGGVRQVGVTTTWRPWVIPPGSPGVVASMQGSSRSLVQQVTDTFV